MHTLEFHFGDEISTAEFIPLSEYFILQFHSAMKKLFAQIDWDGGAVSSFYTARLGFYFETSD